MWGIWLDGLWYLGSGFWTEDSNKALKRADKKVLEEDAFWLPGFWEVKRIYR